MKTLYLIRHAKSSWNFRLDDHDRPLGKRGRKDIHKMGSFLVQSISKPDLIISSTASRTFYTALFLADYLDLDETQITLESRLFHGSTDILLKVTQNAPACNVLGICCHNPGITDFANQIGDRAFDNIPTCGIVGIDFPISNWSDVRLGTGSTRFHYFPKEI